MADQNRFAVSTLSRSKKASAIDEELLLEKQIGEFSFKTNNGDVVSHTSISRKKSHVDSVSILAKDLDISGQMVEVESDHIEFPAAIEDDVEIIPDLPLQISTSSVKDILVAADINSVEIDGYRSSIPSNMPSLNIGLQIDQIVRNYPNPTTASMFNMASTVSTVSSDGKLIAFGGKSLTGQQDACVQIVEFMNGSFVFGNVIRVDGSAVKDIEFTPDGKFILILADYLAIYEIVNRDGLIPHYNQSGDLHLSRMSLSPDGQFLAATGTNKSVKVYKRYGLYGAQFEEVASIDYSGGQAYNYIDFCSDSKHFIATLSTNDRSHVMKFDGNNSINIVSDIPHGSTLTCQPVMTVNDDYIISHSGSITVLNINLGKSVTVSPSSVYAGAAVRTLAVTKKGDIIIATTVEGSDNIVTCELTDHTPHIIDKGSNFGSLGTMAISLDEMYALGLKTDGTLMIAERNKTKTSIFNISEVRSLGEMNSPIRINRENKGFKLSSLSIAPHADNTGKKIKNIIHGIIVVS